jgi:hypothetical protein
MTWTTDTHEHVMSTDELITGTAEYDARYRPRYLASCSTTFARSSATAGRSTSSIGDAGTRELAVSAEWDVGRGVEVGRPR